MPTVVVNGKSYVPKINTAYSGAETTLGDAFKKLRNNMGISLDEASGLAGISKSHLWNIEKNKAEPSLWVAGELTMLYGADIRVLAGMGRGES